MAIHLCYTVHPVTKNTLSLCFHQDIPPQPLLKLTDCVINAALRVIKTLMTAPNTE